MSTEALTLTAADEDVTATVAFDAAMNYALAHNGISPLHGLVVENDSSAPLRDLQLEIRLAADVPGSIAEPFRSRIPEVPAGDMVRLDGRGVPWALDAATFAHLDEAALASVDIHIFDRSRSLRALGTMRLLARDEWWAMAIEESLAAFVTPRARAIQELVGEASDLLGRASGDPSIQGYQGGADRATAIAGAIYDAMRAREIRYINPPASFEGTGQKIRPAHEVLVDRWGTCLDLATTYAAALEHAGLHPVLVLCDGHALVGHLLEEQQLPELVLRDPRSILNYVETGLFIPVETTALCAGIASQPYSEAVRATRRSSRWTHDLHRVRCLIDVVAAHRVVRPLPAVAVEDGVRVLEVEAAPAPDAREARSSAGPATPARADGSARGHHRPAQVRPTRVERWRSSLLDLSFRNPLLNMRSGKTSLDLHVPHGALGALEDLLFDGVSLDVRPHDQIADIHRARGARTAQDIDADSLRALLVEQGTVFGACTEASYLTRMRAIQRRARLVTEETGANNLFVTLGTLEWEDAGRPARAPLFLLPVTLKAPRGRPFALQIEEGGCAQPNQCLLEKLRIGHGLSIPEFRDPSGDASGIDLARALNAIRRALIDARLPFAVEESAHLALLQFSTLQLWQDLSANWEAFMGNPVVRHLVETPTDSFADPEAEAAIPADAEAMAYCPVPIDGAQLQAVSWAEAGRSFVIEGPPGTGKSQTITNLIANALAANKTILFVAEKQAALDVVRRRLDDVGLGDLCLDLHGKDQTPENMRKQLRAALHLQTAGNGESWSATRARHTSAVDSLRRYPAALHKAGAAGMSAWTARQALLTAGDGLSVAIPDATVSQPLDTVELFRVARELTHALYDLDTPFTAHPWRLAAFASLDGQSRGAIAAAVDALAAAAAALPAGPVGDLLAIVADDDSLEIVATWLAATADALPFVDVPGIEVAGTPEWRGQLDGVLRQLEAVREQATPLASMFTPAAVTSLDLDGLLGQARAADGKLFKGKARRRVAAELAAAMQPDTTVEPASLTATLEALIALRAKTREATQQARKLGGLELPEEWNPLTANGTATFSSRVAAILASVELLRRLPAADAVLGAAAPEDFPASAAPIVARLRDSWKQLARLLQVTPTSLSAWRGPDRSLPAAIRATLPAWVTDARNRDLVRLGRWAEVQSRLGSLAAAGLEDFVAGISDATILPEDAESVLRRSLAKAILAERLSSTVLAGFDGLARDRAVQRFAEGAEELRRDMVAELPAKIVGDRTFSPERLVGKVGQLSRELSRKRGGLKIRELFMEYGAIVGELTPCLMMSPHSVARFLPPGALDVDLVVFDEASQIRVAEAIGAMGRAKATVVVGDSQQMPPSSVASAAGGGDDEDEALSGGIPSDMESVLSEVVESNLPRLWLSWHYRSQHEALISFSNHKYYEGRLASFPRPPQDHPGLGVSWRRVDGTYERGAKRVNRVEATAIVDEVRARLQKDADASIGVVTFNTQQRDLILDELEECGDPLVGAALAADGDGLFVKNLENVQGDERDIILFSLAFSPSPETGKLPLNFGPLIRAGGERRLNVAVTRARAQVVLFSSFDPDHLDLARSSSVGLAHLRAYMEMAVGPSDDAGVFRPPPARDRHQDEVVHALEGAGLCVREHVGLSDFTVDLGVAATSEGPWTAVLLDGEQYVKRSTVGDRETLPQGVLVGSMGWKGVERVWLPDWVRDREDVVARIVRAVHEPPTARTRKPASTPEPRLVDIDAPALTARRSPEPAAAREPLLMASAQTHPHEDVTAQMADGAFRPADHDLVGARQDLDDMIVDARARLLVEEQVHDVIRQEGPVEVGRLTRLVCRRFGLQRVFARRAAEIVALVPLGQLEHTPFGTFVWPPGITSADYQDFRPASDTDRNVEEIAPQELLNAMRHLARAGAGISRDELVRETALLFGVRRLTAKPRARVEGVLDDGVQRLQLNDDGATISVGGDPR